jgi:hypothetical protein
MPRGRVPANFRSARTAKTTAHGIYPEPCPAPLSIAGTGAMWTFLLECVRLIAQPVAVATLPSHSLTSASFMFCPCQRPIAGDASRETQRVSQFYCVNYCGCCSCGAGCSSSCFRGNGRSSVPNVQQILHSLTGASPEPRRSTSVSLTEVLRRGSGEAPARPAGRSGAVFEQ